MTPPYVLGIDPGPVVGLVGLRITPDLEIHPRVHVIQCSANVLDQVLHGINPPDLLVAVERFVVGPRAARSNAPSAGRVAVHVVGMLADRSRVDRGYRYIARSAAEVKPWATDTRLAAAGLLEPTKGMRHARDAARHALFAAVKDCGAIDPLSKRGMA